MRPTPKSPQFFSLATPINITGTIRDFHIGVSAGSVIGTAFRFVSSVITVPLQKILTNNMEPDGAACLQSIDGVGAGVSGGNHIVTSTILLPSHVV
ncbi:MAG: hypothetical protein JKP90_21540 [Desulfofustis sp. PB-SRB1]|nr:hypothetical protein [Desulfofustis sp. PB-SRB1]